jgi:copper transport protein
MMLRLMLRLKQPQAHTILRFWLSIALCMAGLLIAISPTYAHSVSDPVNRVEPGTLLAHSAALLLGVLVVGGAGFAALIWLKGDPRAVQDQRAAAGLFAAGCLGLLYMSIVYRVPPLSGDPLLAAFSRWLHLTAAFLWTGGLIALLVALARGEQPRAGLIATFFALTRLCAAVLMLSGLYTAWLTVGSLDGLLSTTYGQALIVKSVLFAALFTLSARNARVQYGFKTPAVKSGAPARPTRFTLLEVALLIAALVATGWMRIVDTPRTITAWRIDQFIHANNPNVYEALLTDDLQIDLGILPGVIGENTVYITLFDAMTGVRLSDATSVEVHFTPTTTNDSTPLTLSLVPQGDGIYNALTALLDTAGEWNAQAVVEFAERGATTASFDFRVSAPLDIPAEDPAAGRLIHAALAVMIGGLLVGLGRASMSGKNGLRPLAWGVTVVGVIFIIAALRGMLILQAL